MPRGSPRNEKPLTKEEVRYDMLEGQTRADQFVRSKYGTDRPIKAMDLDDAKLMKLEINKSKLVNTAKYKYADMLLNRQACKRYINSYGFFMATVLPDALNTIVKRMIDEAIARVYILPGRMERITIRAGDLPFIL